LWLAETSQLPISQTTWLKVTPNCNHCNHCKSSHAGLEAFEIQTNPFCAQKQKKGRPEKVPKEITLLVMMTFQEKGSLMLGNKRKGIKLMVFPQIEIGITTTKFLCLSPTRALFNNRKAPSFSA
jgi:hypothetical protein